LNSIAYTSAGQSNVTGYFDYSSMGHLVKDAWQSDNTFFEYNENSQMLKFVVNEHEISIEYDADGRLRQIGNKTFESYSANEYGWITERGRHNTFKLIKLCFR
jgi:ribonucleotide reductase beta subunit family protein with ferritin-like domain